MSEHVDAGPHATPDQVRAAQKRRDALAASGGRKAEPEQRHAPEKETVADDKPARRGKKGR